jgi:manganese oxidase
MPNFFTINGKAYPETETIRMRVGEKLRVRFLGTHNTVVHPMHIHGGLSASSKPTASSAAGRADPRRHRQRRARRALRRHLEGLRARQVAAALRHSAHTTNDNVEENGGGGLMAVIEVAP